MSVCLVNVITCTLPVLPHVLAVLTVIFTVGFCFPFPKHSSKCLPQEAVRFVAIRVLLDTGEGLVLSVLVQEDVPSSGSIFQGILGKWLTIVVPEPRIALRCPDSNSVVELWDHAAFFYSPAPFLTNQK